MQKCECISLVVVLWVKSLRLCPGDHSLFARVAFTRCELLDRAHRHTLIRHLRVLRLTPARERGHETAVCVCSINPLVTPHFLEGHAHVLVITFEVIEPIGEAQVTHATAVKAARLERL